MTLRRLLPSLATLACTGLLALAGSSAMAATAPESAAADYCRSTGGVSTVVHPYANTNANPRQWVRYGGTTTLCTYTATDGSTIQVFDSTLSSTYPTMAALAYYAKQPMGGGGGNPADSYCVQLGGTYNIGVPGTGSLWTTQPGVVNGDMCVFADGSAIDAWGLAYHSASIVRGIDLSTVLKFADPY
jgi:putative hemolysin